MSLKFGLGGSKKSASQPKRLPSKASFAFGVPDDDDGVEPTSSEASSKPSKKSKSTISQYGDLATQQSYRKNADKALEVDQSIYDYDAAWDAIKAREEAKKEAEKEKAEQDPGGDQHALVRQPVLEQERRRSDPVRECGAVELDTLASVDRGLAVQR